MVLLLDGGSTSVMDYIPAEQHPEIMNSPLWTSQALFSCPDAVSSMYEAYIRSGTTLISCMTYQQSDLTMKHVEELPDAYNIGMQVALDSSRGTQAQPVLTLGTHAAMLSNGAEYTHKYKTEDLPMLHAFHATRLEKFASMESWNKINYIAFETLPDVLEAEVILDVLHEFDESRSITSKRIWISFSCSGEGAVEKVLSGLHRLLKHRNIDLLWGIGINCFKQDVAHVVKPFCEALEHTPLHAIFYRDAGPEWNAVERRFVGDVMDAEAWARCAAGDAVLNKGRVVLGGCCQTGPQHIAALGAQINSM